VSGALDYATHPRPARLGVVRIVVTVLGTLIAGFGVLLLGVGANVAIGGLRSGFWGPQEYLKRVAIETAWMGLGGVAVGSGIVLLALRWRRSPA
jgi:hypothetical protein